MSDLTLNESFGTHADPAKITGLFKSGNPLLVLSKKNPSEETSKIPMAVTITSTALSLALYSNDQKILAGAAVYTAVLGALVWFANKAEKTNKIRPSQSLTLENHNLVVKNLTSTRGEMPVTSFSLRKLNIEIDEGAVLLSDGEQSLRLAEGYEYDQDDLEYLRDILILARDNRLQKGPWELDYGPPEAA